MIDDGRAVPDGTTLRTGLCIVGAGAAGIAIARALRGSGLDVTVLESGGFEFDERINDLNAGALTGEPMMFGEVERPLTDTRRRYFGGSTNHWFGWCRPLDPFDFVERAWVPDSGWPISRADIDPWLPGAHELAELGPVEFDPRAWRRRFGAQRPLLDTDLVAATMFQYSPPTRFGQTYRGDLESAANTRVLLNSNVVNIDSTADADHVTGVDVAVLGGPRYRVEADAFVLATGGVEVPRLLLVSRTVQPEGLGNGNDLVGRYFMEHPHMMVSAAVVTRPPQELQLHQINPYDVDGREVRAQGVFTLTPEAQERFETLNFSAIVFGLRPAPGLAGDSGGATISAAQVADLSRQLGAPVQSMLEFLTISEGGPLPGSRVTLAADTDELGVPRVELDWRHSPLDRHTVQTGFELLGQELGRLGLGRVLIERDGVGPLETGINVGSHHMGTTRMSDDPARGVVDGAGKVHGIDNLFVAGSAVYPTGGSANPTLTLLALALRQADHLATQVLA